MTESRKTVGAILLAAIGCLAVSPMSAATAGNVPAATVNYAAAPAPAFGTIRGFIRDENGNPVAGAVIALFRDGVATVKQIRSGSNGAFSTRVAPGRYTLTAMAAGFSVISVSDVEVGGAEEVAYRFNLVRVGSGNTLPERRAERRQAKWRLRSNQSRRTVFQNNENKGETTAVVEKIETAETAVEDVDSGRNSQSAVETFFASSANGNSYAGLNFATVQPAGENIDLIFAGQTGFGDNAPQRLETAARFKLSDEHRLSLNFSGAKLGAVRLDDSEAESELGQVSFQAIDEWRVRDNVILVIGFDYSRFVGASNADSVAPRLGLQFETDAKTRFNLAYTTQNEPRTWQQAADLEDSRIMFREPTFESYAVSEGQVVMPRLRRLEIGIERVLDNASNLEATAFFDATNNRGVSFLSLPIAAFDGATDSNDLTSGIQNGSAQGVRIVYSRRLNSIFSTNLGYAFGRGQSLSSEGLTSPENLFVNEFFQTVSAQISADFESGTQIRTVWRYSPRRAVFAIDPFAGRMAYYEPSVSILITQKLPTWGLPLRAKAMLDARNLFDFQTTAMNEETALRLNHARRMLRGGIAVRF